MGQFLLGLAASALQVAAAPVSPAETLEVRLHLPQKETTEGWQVKVYFVFAWNVNVFGRLNEEWSAPVTEQGRAVLAKPDWSAPLPVEYLFLECLDPAGRLRQTYAWEVPEGRRESGSFWPAGKTELSVTPLTAVRIRLMDEHGQPLAGWRLEPEARFGPRAPVFSPAGRFLGWREVAGPGPALTNGQGFMEYLLPAGGRLRVAAFDPAGRRADAWELQAPEGQQIERERRIGAPRRPERSPDD